MSAVAGAPPIAPGAAGAPPPAEKQGMSQARKIGYAVLGVWVGGIVLFAILFGVAAHKAPEVASSVFTPIDEFKLDTWFKLGPIAFNKGVLYLLLAAGITIGVMTYIAKRLQERPGRLQVAVESFYDFTRNMTRENFDPQMERKYFPLIATIFVFILVSNLIGYIPLPVNSAEKFTPVRRPPALVPDLRGRHERRLPAGALAGGVRAVHLRGSQTPRADRLSQEPDAGRPERADRAADLRDRDALDLPAADLADRPAVGQPARRPPADRVHGRQARGARRPSGRVLGAAAARDRDLPVRGRPDRRPAGIHLCDLDRHLSRRRGLESH